MSRRDSGICLAVGVFLGLWGVTLLVLWSAGAF